MYIKNEDRKATSNTSSLDFDIVSFTESYLTK